MTDQLALFGVLGDGPARDAITHRARRDACSSRRARVRARPRRSSTGSSRSSPPTVPTSPCRWPRSPRSPSPRRRRPSSATASARELQERADDSARPHESCAPGAGPRSTISTAAAICTLHSFAQRILTEFPIEIGLPPRIEVRDEISSRIAFEARWREFVDELLDDAELESTRARAARGGREAAASAHGRRGARRQLGPARPHRSAAAAARARRRRLARGARRRVRRRATTCSRRRRPPARSARRVRASTATDCAPRSTTRSASSC